MPTLSKLDNPVWHSLNEAHRRFAVGDEELKFYQRNIAPFGGINSKDKRVLRKLDDCIRTDEPFFIIGNLRERV